MKTLIISTIVAIATILSANAQSNIYVDVNATGNESGTSWGNAFTHIQDAIDNANPNDNILIKAGTYKQQAGIYSKSINIYGGFNGTETSYSQADPITNPVIFDADVNGDDLPVDFNTNKGDNLQYHLDIQGNGSISFEVNVEGITFKNAHRTGSGDGSSIHIRADTYIIGTHFKNCKWIQNYSNSSNGTAGGGAIGSTAINGGVTSLYIDKCWFESNKEGSTTRYGSAIISYAYGYESLSNLYVTNSVFIGNTDIGNNGGNYVIYQSVSSTANANTESNSVVRNNTFYGNYDSKAMLLWNGNVGTLNCIFERNIVTQGDSTMVIGNTATANNVYNVNINNNYLPANSIQASVGFGYVNNTLGTTPGFVDAANFNFNLTSSSPCLDIDGSLLWMPDNLDYAGNPRFSGVGVDLGAYEYQYQSTTGVDEVVESSILNIYPNPTNSVLNIEVKENTNIKIVNLLGKTLAEQQLNTDINTINVSNLPSGVYYIQTRNGSTTKFIKQ